MAVTKDVFRKMMGHFATGVTIVTTRLSSGKPWGFTVNSFTSVSMEPPLILVCVDHGTESAKAMAEASHFAVNFLSDGQKDLSSKFASKAADRFDNVPHLEGDHGSPLFEGGLGFIECKKVATHNHGDHAIVIGEVLEAKSADGDPLLFFRSAYRRIEAIS